MNALDRSDSPGHPVFIESEEQAKTEQQPATRLWKKTQSL
jgi:hypothetical protein